GGFGKWGCGGRDSTGVPEKHGFDTFFGYYDQVHAHTFYPPYLVENSEEVPLEGNVGGRSGKTYSHYEIMERGLGFIRDNREKPFFCYLPITPPHGMYDIPADDPAWGLYEGEAWMADGSIAQDVKNYAAMVSMVDHNLGQVLDLLKELGLEENTMVFFTGDNGGQDRFRSADKPRGFFGPNVDPRTGVEFRGGKGNLYEGGLRIPYLVRWPGKIAAGQVSDLIFYQPDVLPTLSELCGAETPGDVDGLSFLPTLLGEGEQARHEYFYWEFGNQFAVRKGDWKAIKDRKNDRWALYDVVGDVSETTDVAAENGDVLGELVKLAEAAHEPARTGTYTDRTRHERDRWAKWGTAKDQPAPKPKRQGKVNKIGGKGLVPVGEMKLVSASSENVENGKLALNAIDGDPRTVWHSRFSTGLAKHPHELVLDLGAVYEVKGFRYLARQDEGWNGAFAETEFFVADSAEAFPEVPAVKVTFSEEKKAQAADLGVAVRGRFVKVRVVSEVGGAAWGSAAEIGVVGKRLRE
ncbi:MAG: sulfatase-like hydrolase/transferase, partial [Verrucomicrobiales bacterium]|nr:sulfatase-like hydrolase/transferase [Verrucomicrobiales bacterium]